MKKKKIKNIPTIGEENVSTCGWRYKVVEYVNAHQVKIEWEDGAFSWCATKELRNGKVKSLNFKAVNGVGFHGYGNYSSSSHPRLYACWERMLRRCYDPYELNKPRGQSYRNTHVCKEWHNFQNFAEWAIEQPYWNEEDSSIDKDILGNNRDLYHPETCCFIPLEVNMQLVKHCKSEGVTVKTTKCGERYIVRVPVLKKRKYIGCFTSRNYAVSVYQLYKSIAIGITARKYKGLIREDVIDMMSKLKRMPDGSTIVKFSDGTEVDALEDFRSRFTVSSVVA